MNKVVEYQVISVERKDEKYDGQSFMERINALLKEGWQPFGAPNQFYGQAMVRYEEQKGNN